MIQGIVQSTVGFLISNLLKIQSDKEIRHSERIEFQLLRKEVGYLIDAAEPIDNGEYIVPGESIEDLRQRLSGKRGVLI